MGLRNVMVRYGTVWHGMAARVRQRAEEQAGGRPPARKGAVRSDRWGREATTPSVRARPHRHRVRARVEGPVGRSAGSELAVPVAAGGSWRARQ